MQKIGKILEEKRKEQEFTIDDICRKTKLPPKTIEALEKGDLSYFENDLTYVKFYLKAYCKVLGINYDDIRESFEQSFTEFSQKLSLDALREHENIEKSINEKVSNNKRTDKVVTRSEQNSDVETQPKSVEVKPAPTKASAKPAKTKVKKKNRFDLSKLTLLLVAFVTCVVLVLSGIKLVSDKSNDNQKQDQVSQKEEVPAKEKKKPAAKKPASSIKVKSVGDNIYDVTGIKKDAKVKIEVKFKSPCWVSGMSDNNMPVQSVVSQEYTPQDTIKYEKVATGNDVITINLGNYQAATVYVNGKEVKKPANMQQATVANVQLNIKAK